MSGKGDPLKYRLRFLLLSLLAIKPSHGYELSKKIEAITLGFVRAGPGSVYPVLHELRKEGLVEEDLIIEGGRAKKIYRLTRKGAEELVKSLDVFQDIVRNLLALAADARRSAERLVVEGTRECVPESVLDRLEALQRTVNEYLSLLRSRPVCRE